MTRGLGGNFADWDDRHPAQKIRGANLAIGIYLHQFFSSFILTKVAGEPQESETDYVLFDENDPRSLISIVWKGLKTRLQQLTKDDKHWFFISENELWKAAKPDGNIVLLRNRFWHEFERAQSHQAMIKQVDVLRGVISQDMWEQHIMVDPRKIAFVCTPPPKYATRLKCLLDKSVEMLGEILEIDHYDKKGKVIPALIAQKIKIFEMLDLRVKGAIAQKLQIDQRVLTADVNAQDVLKGMDLSDLKQLDESIHTVKNQIARAQRRLEAPAPVLNPTSSTLSAGQNVPRETQELIDITPTASKITETE